MTRTDDQLVPEFLEAARKIAHGEAARDGFMPDEVFRIAEQPDLFLELRTRYNKINDPDVRAAVRKLLRDAAQYFRDSKRDARDAANLWDRFAIGSGLVAGGTAGGALLGAATAATAGTVLIGAGVAVAVGIGMRYGFSRRANRRASSEETVQELIDELKAIG